MKSDCDIVLYTADLSEMDGAGRGRINEAGPVEGADGGTEDETQAMIKEYSAKEIRIYSADGSRASTATTSRTGSTSMVIPQVVYTPPTIIIKKASSGGSLLD